MKNLNLSLRHTTKDFYNGTYTKNLQFPSKNKFVLPAQKNVYNFLKKRFLKNEPFILLEKFYCFIQKLELDIVRLQHDPAITKQEISEKEKLEDDLYGDIDDNFDNDKLNNELILIHKEIVNDFHNENKEKKINEERYYNLNNKIEIGNTKMNILEGKNSLINENMNRYKEIYHNYPAILQKIKCDNKKTIIISDYALNNIKNNITYFTKKNNLFVFGKSLYSKQNILSKNNSNIYKIEYIRKKNHEFFDYIQNSFVNYTSNHFEWRVYSNNKIILVVFSSTADKRIFNGLDIKADFKIIMENDGVKYYEKAKCGSLNDEITILDGIESLEGSHVFYKGVILDRDYIDSTFLPEFDSIIDEFI